VILDKNPLPFITGMICTHRCMASCTRNHYEESVAIRDVKLKAAEEGFKTVIDKVVPARQITGAKGSGGRRRTGRSCRSVFPSKIRYRHHDI
jgi:hypothetical protein